MTIVQWNWITHAPETLAWTPGPPRQYEPFPADGRCPYHGIMLESADEQGGSIMICPSQRAGLKHENGVWPVICAFVARR